MKPTAKELRELKERVEQREELVKAIFVFVTSVVQRHGKVAIRGVHNYHTHEVMELADFNGLKFVWSTGNTSMGGNDMQIYYCCVNPIELVFSMSYQQSQQDCKVGMFSNGGEWQEAFTYAVKHTEKLLLEKRAKAAVVKKALRKAMQSMTVDDQLQEKAKRLGLVV